MKSRDLQSSKKLKLIWYVSTTLPLRIVHEKTVHLLIICLQVSHIKNYSWKTGYVLDTGEDIYIYHQSFTHTEVKNVTQKLSLRLQDEKYPINGKWSKNSTYNFSLLIYYSVTTKII